MKAAAKSDTSRLSCSGILHTEDTCRWRRSIGGSTKLGCSESCMGMKTMSSTRCIIMQCFRHKVAKIMTSRMFSVRSEDRCWCFGTTWYNRPRRSTTSSPRKQMGRETGIWQAGESRSRDEAEELGPRGWPRSECRHVAHSLRERQEHSSCAMEESDLHRIIVDFSDCECA